MKQNSSTSLFVFILFAVAFGEGMLAGAMGVWYGLLAFVGVSVLGMFYIILIAPGVADCVEKADAWDRFLGR